MQNRREEYYPEVMIHHMRSITLLTNVEPNTVFNASLDSIIYYFSSENCFYLQNFHFLQMGRGNPYDSQF